MPDLLHSIQITDPDYERAAVTWKSDFLLMPLFACEEALKYMQDAWRNHAHEAALRRGRGPDSHRTAATAAARRPRR